MRMDWSACCFYTTVAVLFVQSGGLVVLLPSKCDHRYRLGKFYLLILHTHNTSLSHFLGELASCHLNFLHPLVPILCIHSDRLKLSISSLTHHLRMSFLGIPSLSTSNPLLYNLWSSQYYFHIHYLCLPFLTMRLIIPIQSSIWSFQFCLTLPMFHFRQPDTATVYQTTRIRIISFAFQF